MPESFSRHPLLDFPLNLSKKAIGIDTGPNSGMASRRLRHLAFVALLSPVLLFLVNKSYPGFKIVLKCYETIRRNESCDSSVKHVQRDEFQRLFRRWIDLAEKHAIPYVITYGSLLGEQRAADMIPGDNDIDVYVDVDYYPRLAKLGEPRNFHEGFDDLYHFVIQRDFTARAPDDRGHWSCNGTRVTKLGDVCTFAGPMARLIHHHNFLDVFAVETRSGFVYDADAKVWYKYSDFYPFVNCTFMDTATNCPKNPGAILNRYFASSRPMCECVKDKWVLRW